MFDFEKIAKRISNNTFCRILIIVKLMDQNLDTIFILNNVVASKNYIKMHLEVMKDMNFFNDCFAFFTILRQILFLRCTHF